MKLSGFTLVEVMVSGAILTIGISGIITGLLATNTTSIHQRKMTQAIHIAEATMETLLIKSKTSADLTTGNHSGPSYNELALQQSGGTFSTEWDIIQDAPISNMMQMEVTVTWPERLGPKSISFTTIR